MFDINQASENNASSGVQYQKPGVYDNVKVSEVLLEKSSKQQVPYIRLVTEGAGGEKGSSAKMFLSTEVKPGKKTSGWGVTARNILDLIQATHNVDEDGAKAIANFTNVTSAEGLQARLATILVGKPFRGKFGGEETAKKNIFAVLNRYESMRVEPTKLKFDPSRDIKPYEGGYQTTSNAPEMDTLPFN